VCVEHAQDSGKKGEVRRDYSLAAVCIENTENKRRWLGGCRYREHKRFGRERGRVEWYCKMQEAWSRSSQKGRRLAC